MNTVGKAVSLTSLTTAMSFLTFLVNDIIPILRFGLITALGVVFTLFLATIIYAISIDKGFNQSKPIKKIQQFTDSIINFLKNGQRSVAFHFYDVLIIVGLYGVFNVQIDNYLTDEINKKSKMYQQTNFFDSHFGGIKPITIFLDKDCVDDLEILNQVEKSIKKHGFVVDFSNISSNSIIMQKMGFVERGLVDKYFFICRSSDEGSLSTLKKLNSLESDMCPMV